MSTTGWQVPITFRGDCPSIPLPAAMRTSLAVHSAAFVYITDNGSGNYTVNMTPPTTVTKLSHSGS